MIVALLLAIVDKLADVIAVILVVLAEIVRALLVVVMCVGVIPSVFAQEPEPEAEASTAIEDLGPPAQATPSPDATPPVLEALPTSPEVSEATVPINETLGVTLVILDPGHGGYDAGCGAAGGLTESALTLTIAQKTAALLRDVPGVAVELTREDDKAMTLDERARAIKTKSPRFVVSIHAGGNPSPEMHGVNVFCASGKVPAERENAAGNGDSADRSRSLAAAMAQAMVDAVSADKPGVYATGVRLLQSAEAPGVLIEVGFLTNPAEEALLSTDEYQQRLAQGIAGGIRAPLAPASEEP